MFWRPHVALFVNETTLLPVLMPFAPAASLLERFPDWLARTLEGHGVPQPFIEGELAQAEEIGLAKSNSRSVLGVMNEFVRLADWSNSEVTDENDLIALAMELSEVPTSPLYGSHVSPDRALAAAVRERL